jgi:hypothetical protein
LFQRPLSEQFAFDAIEKAKDAGEHFKLIQYKKMTLGFGMTEGQPLFDSHGNVKNIYINRDNTEKKRDEEEFKDCL